MLYVMWGKGREKVESKIRSLTTVITVRFKGYHLNWKATK